MAPSMWRALSRSSSVPSPARVQEMDTWRRRRLRAERRRGGRRRKGWLGGSTMEGDTEGRESMRIQIDWREKRNWEGKEEAMEKLEFVSEIGRFFVKWGPRGSCLFQLQFILHFLIILYTTNTLQLLHAILRSTFLCYSSSQQLLWHKIFQPFLFI